MHKTLLAVSAAVATALASPALAGGSLKDAPPPGVVYDWSGIYMGVHIGGGWSGADSELTDPGKLLHKYGFLGAPTSSSHDLDGFLVGGHIGLQRQFGNLVLGVEASLTGGGLDGSSSEDFGDDYEVKLLKKKIAWGDWEGDSSFRTEVSRIFMVTGRVGYARDRWMGYVKGGYASAEIGLDHSMTGDAETCVILLGCANTSFGASSSSEERHHGYTLGGGFEFMLQPNVILGLEYNYIDLGSKTHKGIGNANIDVHNWKLGGDFDTKVRVDPDAIHAVYARMSIKFGHHSEPVAPLK